MNFQVYVVNSLNEINPANLIAGNYFAVPNDGLYLLDPNKNQIGGFKDIFSKITGFAAPFANLIPGFGQVISAGLSVASGLTAGSGTQAKGLAGITAFGGQVMAAFDQLAQQLPQISKADAYAQADSLVAILSDSKAVYQAKNGKDAAALADFKTQAAQRAAAIKQQANALETERQQQTSTATTQDAVLNVGGVSIDTNTLLLLGGGGLILLLLLRR